MSTVAVLAVVAVGKVAVGRLCCEVSCFEVVCCSLGVEVGCFDFVALDYDVGIVLDDVPVAVAACVTLGDVAFTCLDVDIGCLDCIRVAVIECLTDGDVGLSCLDVDMDCVDCIHIPDVDCVSDVVVALSFLEVDVGWLLCIRVGCVVCLYDVVVVLVFDVILVVGVDCVTDHAILSADDVEFDVDVNHDVFVVDPDVTELNDVHCEPLGVVGHVVNADVGSDVVKQAVLKLNRDDVRNLNVVNLSGDDLGIVDVAILHCFDEFASVKLPEDDVHLDDANVVEESKLVRMISLVMLLLIKMSI